MVLLKFVYFSKSFKICFKFLDNLKQFSQKSLNFGFIQMCF